MKTLFPLIFALTLFTKLHSQILISSDEITSQIEKNYTNPPEYIKSIIISKIKYKSGKDSVCAYLIKPKFAQKKLPCIIYNRGGNRSFSILDETKIVNDLGAIAAHGYIILASNYRGSAESTGKDEYGGDEVLDILTLLDLTTTINEIDTSKIGMIGQSRGGMMTYLCLSKTTQIKAAISIAGVSDLIQLRQERPEMGLLFQELIPFYNIHNDSTLVRRSAVFWPDKFDKNCKILLIHGNNDYRVNVSQSERLHKLLKNQNIDSKLIILNDDHKFTKNKEYLLTLIIKWFDNQFSLIR